VDRKKRRFLEACGKHGGSGVEEQFNKRGEREADVLVEAEGKGSQKCCSYHTLLCYPGLEERTRR